MDGRFLQKLVTFCKVHCQYNLDLLFCKGNFNYFINNLVESNLVKCQEENKKDFLEEG